MSYLSAISRTSQIKLILISALLLLSSFDGVYAAWSGISLSIDEIEEDWKFEDGIRLSDTTRLNLQFEEKTRNGIRVGANIGRLTTRISRKTGPADTEKFDASYIGLYLGYPLYITEQLVLHNQAGYQYHSGSRTAPSTEEQIAWREASYLFGVSYRFGEVRVMPFVVTSDISGDLEHEQRTDTFENDAAVSSGINLDLFVDSTSFVRFKLSRRGSAQSFSLRFAREF